MYMYVCMYVCMYVRTYVCMYVCRYMCKDRWRGTESKEQGSAAQAQRALSGAHLRAHSNYVYMYVCMYVCMKKVGTGHPAVGSQHPAVSASQATKRMESAGSAHCCNSTQTIAAVLSRQSLLSEALDATVSWVRP